MPQAFFIIGFLRSGTTALARILDTASNARVFVEQTPKLLVESRQLLEGRLADPSGVLRSARQAEINDASQAGLIYGDKSIAYLPFITQLLELWDAKIVFPTRDGREVVSSLMNWHRHKVHNIYIRAEDNPEGIDKAPDEDPWDYSRMRPSKDDPLQSSWKTLTRFEQCAWYWSAFNARVLDSLQGIDPSHWMQLDMNQLDTNRAQDLFGFLGLEGYDARQVQTLLDAHINSLEDRTGREGSFPQWPQWSAEQTQAFDRLAGGMMVRLQYH